MRFASVVTVALFASFATSFSARGQSTAPSTAPSAERATVMIIPFRAIGDGDKYAWISQAIHEDLLNDLARNSAIRVVRPPTTAPADVPNGLAAARDAGASLLITGSYQVVEDQLRITGEVVDVDHVKPVGQLKATGRERELFQLEDVLATQLWRALPRPEMPTAAAGITEQPMPPEDFRVTQIQPYDDGSSRTVVPYSGNYSAAPTVYDQGNTYVNDYAPTGYVNRSFNSYPYSYYPYGYLDSPFFFTFGSFRGERGRDRDGDHDRGFHRGGRGGIIVDQGGFGRNRMGDFETHRSMSPILPATITPTRNMNANPGPGPMVSSPNPGSAGRRMSGSSGHR